MSGAIDGNVLVYDATASEWKDGVVTTGGIQVVNTGVIRKYSKLYCRYRSRNTGETGVEFDTLTTDVAEDTTNLYIIPRFDEALAELLLAILLHRYKSRWKNLNDRLVQTHRI